MKIVKGSISVPGDKSISHRAALFSAMTPQTNRFTNFNFNFDCTATLHCLADMGIAWHKKDDFLEIEGKPLGEWKRPDKPLYAANSGTTARLLSGILSALPFKTTLTGDASLSKRPMGRIIDPLRQMGADIRSTDGHLPMEYFPVQRLQSIRYRLPVASAQVKSAVLLAGLFAQGETEVIETTPSRDHTERMLKLRKTTNPDGTVSLFSSSECVVPELSMAIPGDFSSAAFFIAAALLLPGSELLIRDVSLNPTRTGLLNVLEQMGARLDVRLKNEEPEPMGDIFVRSQELQNIQISPELVPNIIDEIPILSLLAVRSEGPFVLRGAKELRFKESDRIAALVSNYQRVGVQVREFEDGLEINGPQNIGGGTIQTFGDHRIAMTFAVANLLSDGEIEPDDRQCAAVSFPQFWDTLEEITHG